MPSRLTMDVVALIAIIDLLSQGEFGMLGRRSNGGRPYNKAQNRPKDVPFLHAKEQVPEGTRGNLQEKGMQVP